MLDLVAGIGAAVGASTLYSLGIALQALDAREAPHEEHLRLALARGLVRRGRWLLGTGLSMLGWPLQIVALLLAPLVVVQPALAVGLLVLMFAGERMLARAGIPVTLYADLPYCVLHGWPSWVDGRERDPHRNVDAFWLSFLQPVPEMAELQAADVERLDAERAAQKLEAMQTYATQFSCLNYGGCVLEDPAIHGFEVRWPLRSRGAYGATG